MMSEQKIEARKLTLEEAQCLVNSLQDLIDWEIDEVESLTNAQARVTGRKILLSVQDLINPFTN